MCRSRKHIVPNKTNPKRSTPRHIKVKLVKKIKEKNLKISKGKATNMYKGTLIRLSTSISGEICRPEGSGMK